MDGPFDIVGGRGLADRLLAWVAAARSDEAAAARAREGFLRRTAPENATFAGALVDLAERGGPVLVVTASGRRHRGVVAAVGADFVAVRTADGRDLLLSQHGLASVQPEGRAPEAAGDRPATLPFGLAEALAAVGRERPRVLAVAGAGEEGVAGELVTVGLDVLSVRLDGTDRRTAYLRIDNLTEVLLV